MASCYRNVLGVCLLLACAPSPPIVETTMKQEWVDLVLKLSATKADFYSGARKIIRTKNFTFNDDPLSADDALVMADCGFTKSKMSMLVRNYKNEESIEAAMKL